MAKPKKTEEPTDIKKEIKKALKGQTISRRQIFDQIDAPETQLTAALRELEADGTVVRSGEKRGTKYALAA